MITTTRVTGALVAGMALAGVLAAPASAATVADRHGRDAGTFRSHGACEEAGRNGQRHHWWNGFDCDRRDDHGRDDHDHGRGGRDRHHSDDEWVLRVYR